MPLYLTQIQTLHKTYAWPNIKANTFKEAESKCLKGFEVVGEKIWEINL